MSQDIMEIIKQQIESNPIILYMKGSPNQPQCGFSARATQVLMACGERFAYVDILANPDIRANLPTYAMAVRQATGLPVLDIVMLLNQRMAKLRT